MASSAWLRTIADAFKSNNSSQVRRFHGTSNIAINLPCFGQISTVKRWKVDGLIKSRSVSTTGCLQRPDSEKNDKTKTGDDLETNPFYNKYADKIEKAKKEGVKPVTTLEQMNDRAKYEAKKMKRQISQMEEKMKLSGSSPSAAGKTAFPKKLDDIMMVDQLTSKTGEEIGEIWTEFYKTKPVVSAVIPGKIYDRIYSRSIECPVFIYPLTKDQGYQFILGQFSGDQCYFTSLLDYQVHGENAPWLLNLTHYTELQQEKDVVLMAGEIDQQNLSILEAQFLAQQLQLFYATSDEERFNLVHVFNKQPDKFKYMDVINEVATSRLVENINFQK
eukprot:gene20025-21988_t